MTGSPALRLLMRVPVPWVFVLTYLLGMALDKARPLAVPADSSVLTVVGAALFAVGAAIAGWALFIFHEARTTTVPGRDSAKLVTSGPYRLTRNPMYVVGLVLAYLGEARLLKQVWPALLLPLTIAYLEWTIIPVEEARLAEVFPEAYARYRARVGRWI